MEDETSLLELVIVDGGIDDVELDVFMIRLGKGMLLEILEETRPDVVTGLEADFDVEVVLALELVKIVLLVLDEGFELVDAFRMLNVDFDELDGSALEFINFEFVEPALEVPEGDL